MRFARWAAIAGLAGAVACGGSSSPTGSNDGGNPPPPPPPPANGVNIVIKDFSFTPDSVKIKAGTVVQWVNSGASFHHVISDDGGATFDAGSLAPPTGGTDPYGDPTTTPGGSFQHTFSTPGTFRYHCSNHPPTAAAYANFTGVIVVEP